MPSPGLRGWSPKPLEDSNLLMNSYIVKFATTPTPPHPGQTNYITCSLFLSILYVYWSIYKDSEMRWLKTEKHDTYIYHTNIHSFINVADGQRFNSNNICACKREVGQNRFISFSSSDLKKKIYMHVYLDKC